MDPARRSLTLVELRSLPLLPPHVYCVMAICFIYSRILLLGGMGGSN